MSEAYLWNCFQSFQHILLMGPYSGKLLSYEGRLDLFLKLKDRAKNGEEGGEAAGNTVLCRKQRMIIQGRSLRTIPREGETRF